MTSTARSRPMSTAIPLSQNTAPVHEHRGLYTHDLRRKAKRWQDGFVRFHTFNCRVMLYDEARNFVGDTYYRQAGVNGLQDGDELQLDRGGVLVQVGERLVTQETDLSGLLAKRIPKSPQIQDCEGQANHDRFPKPGNMLQTRPVNLPPRPTIKYTGWSSKNPSIQEAQTDQRQAQTREVVETGEQSERPAKRQRRDDEHIPLWEILKTTRPVLARASTAQGSKTLGSTNHRPAADMGIPSRVSGNKSSSKRSATDDQARMKVKEIIDITSSAGDNAREVGSRGGVYNSSPTRGDANSKATSIADNNRRQQTHRTSFPIETPHRLPELDRYPRESRLSSIQPDKPTRTDSEAELQHATHQLPAVISNFLPPIDLSPRLSTTAQPLVKARQVVPSIPAIPSSPPVSTTNHMSAHAPLNDKTEKTAEELQLSHQINQIPHSTIRPQLSARPLHLATTTPRNTLLCQTLAAKKTTTPSPRRRNRSPVAAIDGRDSDVLTAKARKAKGVRSHEHHQRDRPIQPKSEELDSSPRIENAASASRHSAAVAIPGPAIAVSEVAVATPSRPGASKSKSSPPSPPEPFRSPHNLPNLITTHNYPNTPPDYSRLDAQLLIPPPRVTTVSIPEAKSAVDKSQNFVNAPFRPLRHAISDTTRLSTSKPAHGTERGLETVNGEGAHNATIATNTNANTHTKPPVVNRPFVRIHSNLTTTTRPPAPSRTLRRAETHNGVLPSERITRGNMTVSNNATTSLEAVNGNAVTPQQQERGSWTREAWDLLGWIPGAKTKPWEDGVKGTEGVQVQVEDRKAEAWIQDVLALRKGEAKEVAVS